MEIILSHIDSPLGKLMVGDTGNGICMLEFDDQSRIKKHISDFEKSGYEIREGTSKLIDDLKNQLEEYFEQKRKSFDIQVELVGTDFQKSVWRSLLEIPYGKTHSYLEQSRILGDVKAIRAVASANGQNRISIIVPCHRVVGSNGELTGYGGGLKRKKYLLDLESNQQSLFD